MEIKRDHYLNQLINKQGNGLIKIVTGIRRCGKSYLLNTLFYNYLISKGIDDSHIIVLALDSEESEKFYEPLAITNYIKNSIKDELTYYVILDEIQKVDNFVPILNGLLRIKNVDLYITGSNSKFLSSDVVTEFRGRGDEIHLYPLSFSEFYSVYKGTVYEAWKEYATYGGLPLTILQNSSREKVSYITGQKNSTYLNDVVERHKIKDKENLNILTQIVSSSIGSLVNPLKLSHAFKSVAKVDISEKTIKNYLVYLEEAFIIEHALRFDIKGKQYMSTPLKYYFSDVGLRNSVLNFRQNEESHIMENVIFNELRIRGFNVDVGLIEAKETGNDGNRHKKQLEIDFVANDGDKKYYIQSALRIENENKAAQEMASLNKVDDSFKKILVIKDDIKPYHNESGILIVGLFDFLLNNNSLDF